MATVGPSSTGLVIGSIADLVLSVQMDPACLKAPCVTVGAPAIAPAIKLAYATPEQAADVVTRMDLGSGQKPSVYQESTLKRFFDQARALNTPVAPKSAASGELIPALNQHGALPLAGPTMIDQSMVRDQLDESVTPVLPGSFHIECLERHQNFFGAGIRSPKEQAPSFEQLACRKAVLDTEAVPYVGLAISGPYSCLYKRQRVYGMRMTGPGEWVPQEYVGPAGFGIWLNNFRVDENAMLKLGAVDLGNLDSGEARISAFSTEYGPCTWYLLYQTDVRAHQELLVEVRLDVMLELKYSSVTGYDPDRPWNLCFRRLVSHHFEAP